MNNHRTNICDIFVILHSLKLVGLENRLWCEVQLGRIDRHAFKAGLILWVFSLGGIGRKQGQIDLVRLGS